MGIWTAGYVTDIGYTFGFYPDLSPASLKCALRMAGHELRLRDDFTYCELGIGQGITAALLAASHPNGQFFGNDFNASHVLHARDLAAAAGVKNLTVSPASFQNYADDPDLPESFDVIALHGIYSWVDGDLRAAIRDFVKRKLAVGGVLYISYNALPGWSTLLPLHQLILQRGARGTGNAIARVQEALAFADRMKELNGGFFKQNPGVANKLNALKSMSPSYVAHEYFNHNQEPYYFSAMADEMAEIGLTYAAPANFPDRFARQTLTKEQRAFLDALPTEIERESMFDFIANQVFRRDLFVRGERKMSPVQAGVVRLEQRFAAIAPLSAMPEKVTTVTGAASIRRENVEPVLVALLERPSTVGELAEKLAGHKLTAKQIDQSIEYLLATGCIVPALAAAGESDRRKSTDAFNAHVLARSTENSDLMYLASPVTGQGVALQRMEMQMLQAFVRTGVDVAGWTKQIWSDLRARGERLMKDGKPLASDDENVAEIGERITGFIEKRVPVLRTLGVID